MEKGRKGEPLFQPEFSAGVAAIFAVVAIYGLILGPLSFQVFWWLQSGIWTPLPIRDFLPLPPVEWVGLRVMIDWVWGCSIAVPLALAGLAVFVVLGRSGK